MKRTTFILSLLLFSLSAFAEVPRSFTLNLQVFSPNDPFGFSYQGAVKVELFDTPTGGEALWSEVHENAQIKYGFMTLAIGTVETVTPLSEVLLSHSGSRLFVQLTLQDMAETLPKRIELTSVPFALASSEAENAQTLQGQPPSAFALAGHKHAWTEIANIPQAFVDGQIQWGEITEKPSTFPPSPHTHSWTDLQGVPQVLQDGKVGWDEVTGKPQTFPPSQHTHLISEVTGLQVALDGKAPTNHNHDDRYYQKYEVQGFLALKENVGTCYTKSEVQQMLADLRAQILAEVGKGCPSDMVKVGDFCVDKYEASIWERKDGQPVDCGQLQKAVDEAIAKGWTESEVYYGYKASDCGPQALAMCNYRQYGSPPGCNSDDGCDDYPAAFPDSGNWTRPLYACSIRGVMPSRSMTWFQAQQACVNSGKHLITNGEWQAAVAGTPDPGESNGADGSCNTKSGGLRKTGLGSKCVSKFGVEDMIGNLWEWVDLWGQVGQVNTSYSGGNIQPWPQGYAATDEDVGTTGMQTMDATWNINGTALSIGTGGMTFGLPGAPVRGGSNVYGVLSGAFALRASQGPSHWNWSFGLRCARSL